MKDFLIEYHQIILTLAGIGTFISSIIAIYTLIEVKRQRLSTYKPEILIKSFIVYLSKSPLFLGKEELLKFKTSNFNDYNGKDLETNSKTSPLYKVENLGFGLAKNVKLTWSFDMAKAIKLLEAEFYDDLYFSQYKPLNYFFLHKKSDDDFQISLTNRNTEIQNIDYIAPINIKDHTLICKIFTICC